MESLKEIIAFFQAVELMNREQRVAVISAATEQQAKVIGEIAVNVLQRNLVVSADDKIRLLEHKDFIRNVGSAETTPEVRLELVRSHPDATIELILATVKKLVKVVKCRSTRKG